VASTATETLDKLASEGGEPSFTIELPPRQRWGEAEVRQLEQMIEQPSLFYWKGPQTELLIERFREHYPLKYVMPCSSGTASLHIAVAAAGIGPGDEVITSPITDMGTAIGILYQQGVPVFADLQPYTYCLDPADVRRKITPRTKAIIAVHLTGNPSDMDNLRAIAREHNLVLIEDCAQAWGAQYQGQPLGTIGDFGCFSLNDFKHIGCGDGGIVATNDERFGPLLQKFGDKAYDRSGGGRAPDVLAPNYRISEPQSAVAATQMERMPGYVAKRVAAGEILNEALADVPGIHPPKTLPGCRSSFWFYMMRVDTEVLSCSHTQFAETLTAEGLGCGAGYSTPIYMHLVFQTHNFFAGRWPIKELGLTEMDYTQVSCPVAEAIFNSSLVVGLDERMTEEWAEAAAKSIKKVAAYYRRS
jgi:dTDP-4-amino-4,6-dideoxygalactose transaminase